MALNEKEKAGSSIFCGHPVVYVLLSSCPFSGCCKSLLAFGIHTKISASCSYSVVPGLKLEHIVSSLNGQC